MKSGKWMLAVFFGLVTVIASGCDKGGAPPIKPKGGNKAIGLSGEVKIDGSSTVYPISEAAASQFMKKYPDVKVTVAVSGTGGGFKRFTIGETDVSDASRPIKDKEFNACKDNKVKFIELPVAYDGLTIAVHRENDWVEQLTIEQLQKIFLAEGEAKSWKDVDESWPDTPIKIFAPGEDSGTYDYFKEVVADDKPFRDDISKNEDDGVLVTGIAGEKGAIGYFGASYYFNNQDKLKAVKIINPADGKPVAPTAETIESGQYAPFSRPLFIYVNLESIKRPEMKKFIEFYLEHAAELAVKVDYVGLPSDVSTRINEHFTKSLTGTHFLDKDFKKLKGSLVELYTEDNRLDFE